MMELDLERLRKKLIRSRQKVFQRYQSLGEDWQALSERDKRELEDIKLALAKMAGTIYGICESCRKPISQNRLEIFPALFTA
ncbi:MAG: hypothetical protein IH613_07680 [Desulfuromonadales bacterium]|nr:hypothetical protein [Desulfuromonadales bacterium]